jgi:hypothetical protein
MLLARAKSFFRNLFRERRADHDLDEELRAYLDQLTEEKIAAGAGFDQARRQARIELAAFSHEG